MNPQSSIKVKLLSNGRYTWEINYFFDDRTTYNSHEAIQSIKQIDTELREEFPNHTQPSSARVHELED